MKTLQFSNTLTKTLETFTPLNPPNVRLYTCGPTVYDYAHIGNFRTYVFEDILHKTLEYFGYNVTHVMNLTDVDDKTIRGAIHKNLSLEEYVAPYIDAFFEDSATLDITRPDHTPKATDYIEEMIAMIAQLLEKGVAYQTEEGSVYFSIHKFSEYGKLSHQKLSQLQEGASERVCSDEYDKDSLADFVLWKEHDPERDGAVYWESPFGPGRPGWHLECSAMARALLGPSIDIHCGAVDNIFPHHENEIAQSECCHQKPLAHTWLHSEHLIVEGHKMSKSAGNFYTLRDILHKGYSGREIRYLLGSVHYKTPLNFTWKGLESARASLRRIDDFLERLKRVDETHEPTMSQEIHTLIQEVEHALAHDLNTSKALGDIFTFIRKAHQHLDKHCLGQHECQTILDTFARFDRVFCVFFHSSTQRVPPEVLSALEERQMAREQKNWQESDRLRDLIASYGFTVEDTPKGQTLKS